MKVTSLRYLESWTPSFIILVWGHHLRRGSRKKHLGGLAPLNFPSPPVFPTLFPSPPYPLNLPSHHFLPIHSLPVPPPSPFLFPHPFLPLPFPFPSPPFPFFLPLPSLPLEVGPLKSSYGVWGSAVSSPAKIEFGAFLALKSDIWWQQF